MADFFKIDSKNTAPLAQPDSTNTAPNQPSIQAIASFRALMQADTKSPDSSVSTFLSQLPPGNRSSLTTRESQGQSTAAKPAVNTNTGKDSVVSLNTQAAADESDLAPQSTVQTISPADDNESESILESAKDISSDSGFASSGKTASLGTNAQLYTKQFQRDSTPENQNTGNTPSPPNTTSNQTNDQATGIFKSGENSISASVVAEEQNNLGGAASLVAGSIWQNSAGTLPLTNETAESAPSSNISAQADDITTMLQQFCSNIYLADIQNAQSSHMMVDLGSVLPGSAVEMAREGTFLNVRVLAADDTMLRLMKDGSDNLLSALTKSTGMTVRLDVVQRTGAGNEDV